MRGPHRYATILHRARLLGSGHGKGYNIQGGGKAGWYQQHHPVARFVREKVEQNFTSTGKEAYPRHGEGGYGHRKSVSHGGRSSHIVDGKRPNSLWIPGTVYHMNISPESSADVSGNGANLGDDSVEEKKGLYWMERRSAKEVRTVERQGLGSFGAKEEGQGRGGR